MNKLEDVAPPTFDFEEGTFWQLRINPTERIILRKMKDDRVFFGSYDAASVQNRSLSSSDFHETYESWSPTWFLATSPEGQILSGCNPSLFASRRGLPPTIVRDGLKFGRRIMGWAFQEIKAPKLPKPKHVPFLAKAPSDTALRLVESMYQFAHENMVSAQDVEMALMGSTTHLSDWSFKWAPGIEVTLEGHSLWVSDPVSFCEAYDFALSELHALFLGHRSSIGGLKVVK